MTLIRSVVLKGFKKEGCALLELVKLKEHVDNLVNVCFGRTSISVGNHFSKIYCSLGVDWNNLTHDLDEVSNMAGLLAVWHNLIKLSSFNQTLNNFVRRARLLVNIEGKLRISSSDNISKLVSHSELLLFDPVLNQI